ncbi:ATP-binding cassette domain-containing protein [Pseudobutyrivibrio ruminis]|uniref:ABC transporter domain-containing protein n=2 Tax=Pseudobutyrivibrio TaxID=46205 RepID=A0A2G3DX51_9FIRM|nr:ABC transporter ATP-binding protein [Pseudobutyrivibrio ruminis]PHU35608.1 hypothetical protein CSX01_03125 [Pseudobutyrivibrio ruminis]
MLELKNIVKRYDSKTIFEGVNMCLREGTVTCLVGHNGCGKSTLLKVTGGLIPKDGGEVIREKNYSISFVPDHLPVANMKAGVYLNHIAKMAGLTSENERYKLISNFAADFFLSDMLDKKMKNLSKGSLQKVGVIQALIVNPDIILLDEPLSGQDCDSQQVFIQKMLELKEQQKIILLASHEQNLIKAIGDETYTIEGARLIPYTRANHKMYSIVLEDDGRCIPSDEMHMENGNYIVKTTDGLLSITIDRLMQEGWHIKGVYEVE